VTPRLEAHDRLPLPRHSEVIRTSAVRQDAYSVHVVGTEPAALDLLAAHLAGRTVALITDSTVNDLHGRRLAELLRERQVRVRIATIRPGERSKDLGTACGLLDWLARTDLARRDMVLAMGGGVVLDTAGWVASAYMRGIDYVNLPTSLLAQVDAAIGGKVGVDHGSAKNLVGAFHQPVAVVSCLEYLTTLDARQTRSGLAEVIKKAVIASPDLFEFLEQSLDRLLAHDPATLATLVHAASAIKCELVQRDPYEKDLRRPLNFGHTVGHAVETATGYGTVMHGEAVAFGMAVAVRLAGARGLIDAATQARVLSLVSAAGLPVRREDLPDLPAEDTILGALDKIRQIRGGSLRFVLPTALGSVVIRDDVSSDEIRTALNAPTSPAVSQPARAGAA
jgi:3-dehydroquinate synthase